MFFINHQENHHHNFNNKHPKNFIGEIAVVTRTIQPNRKGQVYIDIAATWYSSLCLEDITIETESIVRIIGVKNNSLLVEPI
jgi:membrane protein implicated in regulation of membrane protease activity